MSTNDPNSGQPGDSSDSPAPPAPPAPPTPDMYSPPAPYQSPGYAYPPQAPTNSLAIIAFVSSLVGLTLLPFVGSVAAVIMGHISLNQLKSSAESGRAFALAGTIIGWVGVGFGVLAIVAFVLFFFIAIAASSSWSSGGYYS